MTSEQITKAEDIIYDNVGGRYNYFRGAHTREFTDEEQRGLKVLSCRSMIISLLHFFGLGYKEPTAAEYLHKEYNFKYLKDYVANLGEDEVLKLITEQIKTFKTEKRTLEIDSRKAGIIKAFKTLKGLGWRVIFADGKAELTNENQTYTIDMNGTARNIQEQLFDSTRGNIAFHKIYYDLIYCSSSFDDDGEYSDLTV